MDGIEVAPAPVHVPGLEASSPEEDLDRLDLFYSLLLISSIVRGRTREETIAYAAAIYDEMLANIKDKIPVESTSLLNPPLVDALEAADCIGPDALRDALEWAIYRLHEAPREPDMGLLEAYAECLGWDRGPIGVDERVVAGGVILSFTGSLNKYIARHATY